MNTYKALFLDIDGVVVKDLADRINDGVAAAINKLSKNVHVIFCTGRNLIDTLPLIDACDLKNQYHILESGTRVLGPNLKWEYVKKIDNKIIPQILDLTRDIRESFGICQEGKWITDINELNQEKTSTILSINTESSLQTTTILKRLSQYTNLLHFGVGSHYIHKNGNCIHITEIDAGKSLGVRYLQKKLNLSKSECIAAGDMPADFDIAKECNILISPENSDPEVLKKADYIFPSVSELGIIKACDYIIKLNTK